MLAALRSLLLVPSTFPSLPSPSIPDLYSHRHPHTEQKGAPFDVRMLDFTRQILLTLTRDAAPLLAKLREVYAQDIAKLSGGNQVG